MPVLNLVFHDSTGGKRRGKTPLQKWLEAQHVWGPEHPSYRDKGDNPYSYSPQLVWLGRWDESQTNLWSDRLASHYSLKKYRELVEKHLSHHSWSYPSPDTAQCTEAFLQELTGNPQLRLCAIIEHCNQSTGYQVMCFSVYLGPKEENGN
jgi:hypothetical protein